MRPLPVLALASMACTAVFGCSIFAPGELEVVVSADSDVASPDDPVHVTVTARNVGETRVTFGPGSSSCQLHLAVRVDGEDRPVPEWRPHHQTREGSGPRRQGGGCLADLSTHALGPGQSRTELLAWDGMAQDGLGGPVERLSPGSYEVRGVARGSASSAPVVIELRAAD